MELRDKMSAVFRFVSSTTPAAVASSFVLLDSLVLVSSTVALLAVDVCVKGSDKKSPGNNVHYRPILIGIYYIQCA